MPISTPKFSRRQFNQGLSASTALASSGFSHQATAQVPKDTLVVAWAIDDIISLDPAEVFELSAGELMGNCYDRLVRINAADPSKIVPDLALDWTVGADGKTYTFNLRPNVKFASGNAFTSEDVVYSLMRAMTIDKSPAFILRQFGLTKEQVAQRVRAVNPTTVVIETDKVYAPTLFLNCLTANVACIVDKKLVSSKEVNGDLGYAWMKTNFAGSGPMKIREWRANELAVTERNDNYWGTKATLARVVYRHIKESATQRLLLEKGDIDIARNLTPQDLDAVSKNAAIKTTNTTKGYVVYFSLNMKNPILAKPEVREAFKWLVDYQALANTIIKNIGVVHQNFLPVGMLGASTVNPYKLDVEKAKALLAKAGHANGFKVTMDVRSTQPIQGIAEAVQQTLKRAGIELEILPGDGKQTLTKYRARQHDMYIGQWGADYWDPHTNADTFARNPDNSEEAKTKPLAWRNSWVINDMTKKADAAMLERDPAKRRAIYTDIQEEFRRTSPFVMLYQQIDNAAYRGNVENVKLGATSDATYMFKVTKR